jgi:hypothetical protein
LLGRPEDLYDFARTPALWIGSGSPASIERAGLVGGDAPGLAKPCADYAARIVTLWTGAASLAPMRARYVERLAGLDQDCGLRFSSTSWPIVSAFAEEPRPITRC